MFVTLLWGQVSDETKKASEEMPLSLQIQILETSVQKFSESCLIDGKLNPKSQWCIAEKAQLDQDYQRLQKLTEKQQLAEKTNTACRDENTSVNKDIVSQIDKAIAKSLDPNNDKECKQNTEVLSTQCAKELACGSYRMLSQHPLLKYALPPSNSCKIDGQESSCIRELIHGVVKDIFHNVKAITHDIPKLLKDATIGTWNWLFGVEDKTSDSLMMATATSDKSLKEWATDKLQFVTNFVSIFISAINEGIKKSFGCGAWDGPPHFSKCLKPMKSWDCASCLQRINAACGIVGYLGGEIVSMYMVGGALAVTKAVASAGKGAVANLGNSMIKAVGSNEKLASYLDITKSLGTKIGSVLAIPLSELKKSLTLIGGVLQSIKIPGILQTEFAKTIGGMTSQGIQISTYPVTSYSKVLGDAISVGYKHGENVTYLFGKAKNELTLALALQGSLKAHQVIKVDEPTAQILKSQTNISSSNPDYLFTYDESKRTLTIQKKRRDASNNGDKKTPNEVAIVRSNPSTGPPTKDFAQGAVEDVIAKNNARRSLNPIERNQEAKSYAQVIVDARREEQLKSGLVTGDQYFTMGTKPVEKALNGKNLNGTTVLDFGAGTGIITTITESAKPTKILAWEIDPAAITALKKTTDSKVTEIVPTGFGPNTDWQTIVQTAGGGDKMAIISNPPYFAIDEIKKIADANNIRDVILYIPKKKLTDFPEKDGWQVVGSLGAKDFYPHAPTTTATGKIIEDNNHVVVARGRFVNSKK